MSFSHSLENGLQNRSPWAAGKDIRFRARPHSEFESSGYTRYSPRKTVAKSSGDRSGLAGLDRIVIGLWMAQQVSLLTPSRWLPAPTTLGDWATAAELARQILSQHKDDPARCGSWLDRRLGSAATTLPSPSTVAARWKAIQAEDHVLMGLAYQRRGQADAAAQPGEKCSKPPEVSPQLLEELARLHLQGRIVRKRRSVSPNVSAGAGLGGRGLMMLGTIRAALNDVPAPPVVPPGDRPRPHRGRQIRRSDPAPQADRPNLPAGGRTRPCPVPLAIDSEARTRPRGRLAAQPRLPSGRRQGPAQAALAQAGSYRADNPLEPEPSPYVGEARCEKCHPAIFRDSLASRHTQTYYRGDQLDAAPPSRIGPCPTPTIPR